MSKKLNKQYNKEFLKLLKFFGKRVKFFREQQKISADMFSEKAKIRKTYLNRIENGLAVGITVTHIVQIAEALGVKAEDLLK